MIAKTRTILTFSLYALAFLCCLLAILMLLIPFNVALEQTVYAVPPGQSRTEVTSETSYYSKTFFGYIDYLEFQNWTPNQEVLLVVSLISSLAISSVLIVMEIFLFVHKKVLENRGLKIMVLSVSVLPLISFVLAIILQADVSTWKVCGHESIYLSGYPGWSFYEETLVGGSVLMIPVIIFMFIAFSAQCAAGVLKLFSRDCNQHGGSDFSVNTEKNDSDQNSNENNSYSSDPAEELKRYKQLLDDGIITQEDYDIKKKELLNI